METIVNRIFRAIYSDRPAKSYTRMYGTDYQMVEGIFAPLHVPDELFWDYFNNRDLMWQRLERDLLDTYGRQVWRRSEPPPHGDIRLAMGEHSAAFDVIFAGTTARGVVMNCDDVFRLVRHPEFISSATYRKQTHRFSVIQRAYFTGYCGLMDFVETKMELGEIDGIPIVWRQETGRKTAAA